MIRFLRSLTGQIVILVLLAAFVGWTVFARYREQAQVAAVPNAATPPKKLNPLDSRGIHAGGPTAKPASPAEGLANMALRTGGSIARLIVPESQAGPIEPVEKTIPKPIRELMLAPPESLTLFVSAEPVAAKAPAVVLNDFAPYGRMIRCKLVTGLESSNLTTPLVGITIEDLWNRGLDGVARLIIPAGVEVHGPPATHSRLRDRLEASGAFMFVWRTSDEANGRELSLKGIALTRDVDPESGLVRPDDGSGGIRGEVIETASNAELKLFAAAFLQAASAGAYQTQTFVNPLTNSATPTVLPTLRNAGVAGTQAVLDEFAGRIRKQLTDEGHYVAIPAGREFYVYIAQTIDLRKATRAGIAIASEPQTHVTLAP